VETIYDPVQKHFHWDGRIGSPIFIEAGSENVEVLAKGGWMKESTFPKITAGG
jgi:hypothetical protein